MHAPNARQLRPWIAIALLLCLSLIAREASAACVAPNVAGTAILPVACDYFSIGGKPLVIANGLPPNTTIELVPTLTGFFNINEAPGGALGGTSVSFDGSLELDIDGTGALALFNRFIVIQVGVDFDTAARTPTEAVQAFETALRDLSGQAFGDPDFQTLVVAAGSDNGLAGPGHTTLTRLGGPGQPFDVISFFDVVFEIEYQGAPGSLLDGFSGIDGEALTLSVTRVIPLPPAWLLLLPPLALLGGPARARRR